MRGTGFPPGIPHVPYRITPACAGNRPLRKQGKNQRQDHPRVCGEQITPDVDQPLLKGSPPRVRGTGHRINCRCLPLGITPACAGNSTSTSAPTIPGRDHPRVCGEQPPISSSPVLIKGSPPRVRGTGHLPVACCREPGITPACAGNSRRGTLIFNGVEDHPRVCGEQRNVR